MKLNELAKEPKLTKIIIDDAALVEKYGEPIKFHIYETS